MADRNLNGYLPILVCPYELILRGGWVAVLMRDDEASLGTLSP